MECKKIQKCEQNSIKFKKKTFLDENINKIKFIKFDGRI